MCPIVNPNFENESRLQPGTYRAKIIGCQMKESTKGSHYLNWKFETVDDQCPGQWVYTMTGLSGKGAQKLKALVQAAYDASYEGGAIDTDQLINCELMITIDKGINPDGSESKYMQVTDVARVEDIF